MDLTSVFAKSIRRTLLTASLLVSATSVFAQTGTYQLKRPKGAYCAISVQRSGDHIKAEVFAWWNSFNAQMGSYVGEGVLKNKTAVLHSDENESDCKVTLNLTGGKVKATFASCATDHLTEDFNGLYTKITDAVAGDYTITSDKAYFYKKPDSATKGKAYVVKGDKVTLDMQNIAACTASWVLVSFMNKAGKETLGYMPLTALKLVK